MNTQRLLLLADALDRQQFAVKSKFDLDTWFTEPLDEHYNVGVPPTTSQILMVGSTEYKVVDPCAVSCDTSACAVGHAALMPEFRHEGLSLVLPSKPEDGENAVPHFEGEFGWTAVRNFFGISSHAAHRIFNTSAYGGFKATPQQVAKRIRALVSLHASETELLISALSEVTA